MDLREQLLKAISFAVNAHGDRKNKKGEPYILHCFRVMNAGQTLEEKIVGMLHDVLKNTKVTIANLLTSDFSQELVDAVHTLTELENEELDHYIARIKRCDLATRVKLNKLIDNMDLRKLKVLADDDVMLLRRYLYIYNKLNDK